MRLSADTVSRHCHDRHVSLQELLRRAGVSHNAYYTLARKESVLPKSLCMVAKALGVDAGELLTNDSPAVQRTMTIIQKTSVIAGRHAGADPDNIRHTLILLQKRPVERLRRALLRAQSTDTDR